VLDDAPGWKVDTSAPGTVYSCWPESHGRAIRAQVAEGRR